MCVEVPPWRNKRVSAKRKVCVGIQSGHITGMLTPAFKMSDNNFVRYRKDIPVRAVPAGDRLLVAQARSSFILSPFLNRNRVLFTRRKGL
jgi:hypothetical protein